MDKRPGIYLALEVSTGFKYWVNDTVVDFLFNAQGKKPIEAIKKKLIKKYDIKNYEDRFLSLLKFLKKIGWIQNSTTSNINKAILLNCLPIEYQLDNLTICITNRCNFDCVYCYNKISDKLDFPQDKLFELLESSLDECGIMSVTITGGEPLLYKNLFSVIKYIKRMNRQCNLLTNGSLLTFGKIDELKKVGLDKIGISLDSIDENIYRQLTNSDKSLNNIIKYIKYCNNIGLSIDINTVFVEGVIFHPLCTTFS